MDGLPEDSYCGPTPAIHEGPATLAGYDQIRNSPEKSPRKNPRGKASPTRRRNKRQASDNGSDAAQLTGQALLAWLMARRAARGADELRPCSANHAPAARQDENDDGQGTTSHAELQASNMDKEQVLRDLHEQLRLAAEILGSGKAGDIESELVLVPEPPNPAALVRGSGRRKRARFASVPVEDIQVTTVLPPTRLPADAARAAQATDLWDAAARGVLAEAARSQRRAHKVVQATSRQSGAASPTLPWTRSEASAEVSRLEAAMEQLRHRMRKESGRRVWMRRHGAQPRAGLFDDPPQGGSAASAAASAAQEGCLPACSTGNELEAAAFLPALPLAFGRKVSSTDVHTSLAGLLDAARPGLVGAWQPLALPASSKCVHRRGNKDILSCLRVSRSFSVGASGCFVGRLAREGLTYEQPFASAGGYEHCVCNICCQWVPRSQAAAHCCVGQGNDSKGRWRCFHQVPTASMGLHLRFRHLAGRPAALEVTIEAFLEAALCRAAWACAWDPARLSCRWRLACREGLEAQLNCFPQKDGAGMTEQLQDVMTGLTMRRPRCDAVPGQPRSFRQPLSSAQLVLLGWMRQQESAGSSTGYVSHHVLRESLCESDLVLELMLEQDFRGHFGGLVITASSQDTDGRPGSSAAGGDTLLSGPSSKAGIACILALILDEARGYCKPVAPQVAPLLSRGRCRLETGASLVVVSQESLACWQQSLEKLVDPASFKVVIVRNHNRMRSLTVADILGADLVLVPLQLFSSEAYQRHFDQLSKPGLQVWDAASLRRREALREHEAQAEVEAAPTRMAEAELAPGAGSEAAGIAEVVAEEEEQPPPPPSHGEGLSPGVIVELFDLCARPDLNGRRGRLLAWQEDSGRWNCRLLRPAPGTRVASGEKDQGKRGRRLGQKRRGKRSRGQQLVNVRPSNCRPLRRGKRCNASQQASAPKRRRRARPARQEGLAEATPLAALKASRYYTELRSREDYLARRQVDLERRTLRLLRQATGMGQAPPEAGEDAEDAAAPQQVQSDGQALAKAAAELAAGPALLEMFRFRRLVLDGCDAPARQLGKLLTGSSSSGGLAPYLATAAPLYAIHALEAHARWGLASGRCLRGKTRNEASEVAAQLASLLGINLPWRDPAEAQRFLDTWAAEVGEEDDHSIAGVELGRRGKVSHAHGSGGSVKVHTVELSLPERVLYLFQLLEQQAVEKAPERRRVAEQERALLELCTHVVLEGEQDSEQHEDPCSRNLWHLLERLEAAARERSAEASSSASRQTDFELRLQARQVLEAAMPGNDREVLLACAHSSAAQLRALLAADSHSLEVQLRRLAQAAAEGRTGLGQPAEVAFPAAEKVESFAPAAASDTQPRLAGEMALQPPAHAALPGSQGCAACAKLLGRGREVLGRLRLASGSAAAAERRASQRLRVMQALIEASGLRPSTCDESRRAVLECALGAVCPDFTVPRDPQPPLLLLPCGHTCHAECLPAAAGRCPKCQATLRVDEASAVCLNDVFPQADGKASMTCPRYGSKLEVVVRQISAILESPEGRAAQCLVFLQWPAAMAKLERALRAKGLQTLTVTSQLRDRRRRPAETMATAGDAEVDVAVSSQQRVLLLSPELMSQAAASAHGSELQKHLSSECVSRHVMLLHPLQGAANQELGEEKILEFVSRWDSDDSHPLRVHVHRFVARGTVEEVLLKQQRRS
eukprot:TRINITY_DN27147_c0_g1_i1.p1 TRINITY_DN27147_c0_g1~~TRINITY_DN27147_c0_g1_i1.p1  ORF type:complete len:1922 (-),score=400.77 TRINITY_DN27147_c0_g1_i1:58-5130(-)